MPTPTGPSVRHDPALERRTNPRLRELVDEMLASIRAAANVELWSPEERRRCDAQLAEIMATVRAEAISDDATHREPRARLS